MPVKIEKMEWGGWRNCYRMSNGTVDLIVTSDIGPRIMRYGFIAGPNLFKVFESQQGKSGEFDWQHRGGHRIWLAPEHKDLTYAPDNGPVDVQVEDDVLIATQPAEPLTGIVKQLRIRMAPTGSHVEVLHRMQNTLPFAASMAPWALTMLAPGGTAITGFPPRARHEDALSPTNPLVMWAFTDLRDKRWTFLEKYLILRHDPAAITPTKLGHFNQKTWGAYLLGTDLFVKRYSARPGMLYPDMGCSYETFANSETLEIETLGPITAVTPGEWLEHIENWTLHPDVPQPLWTDEGLDAALNKFVTMGA